MLFFPFIFIRFANLFVVIQGSIEVAFVTVILKFIIRNALLASEPVSLIKGCVADSHFK